MGRFRKLLPTREEGRSIWIQVLIGSVVAVLAIVIGALVPAVRDMAKEAYFWTLRAHVVPGRLIVLLTVFCAVGLIWIGLKVRSLFQPRYVRQFVEAEYHSMIWRWKWRDRQVDRSSMRAYCVKHGTQLQVTTKQVTANLPTNMTTIPVTSISCPACNQSTFIQNCADLYENVRSVIESDAIVGNWVSARDRVPKQFRGKLRAG